MPSSGPMQLLPEGSTLVNGPEFGRGIYRTHNIIAALNNHTRDVSTVHRVRTSYIHIKHVSHLVYRLLLKELTIPHKSLQKELGTCSGAITFAHLMYKVMILYPCECTSRES